MTTDIQLSEAACDPVRQIWSEENLRASYLGYDVAQLYGLMLGKKFVEPQDLGIETFSTDTLEGGLPDD